MDKYDVAQICINGHLISDSIIKNPEDKIAYCEKCGTETIITCQECSKPIRGFKWISGVVYASTTPVPSYCHHCGKPYPWTQAKKDAAIELAQLLDLDELEEALLSDFNDLTVETPRTKIAAFRFEKLAGETKSIFRDLLVEILAETAKRTIYPE